MALLAALIIATIVAVVVIAVDTFVVWIAFDLLHDAIPAVPHLGLGASLLVAVALWLVGTVLKGARN